MSSAPTPTSTQPTNPIQPSRAVGTVKRFNSRQFYGFVTCPSGLGDFFFHLNDICKVGDAKWISLPVGTEVSFIPGQRTQDRHAPHASDIRQADGSPFDGTKPAYHASNIRSNPLEGCFPTAPQYETVVNISGPALHDWLCQQLDSLAADARNRLELFRFKGFPSQPPSDEKQRLAFAAYKEEDDCFQHNTTQYLRALELLKSTSTELHGQLQALWQTMCHMFEDNSSPAGHNWSKLISEIHKQYTTGTSGLAAFLAKNVLDQRPVQQVVFDVVSLLHHRRRELLASFKPSPVRKTFVPVFIHPSPVEENNLRRLSGWVLYKLQEFVQDAQDQHCMALELQQNRKTATAMIGNFGVSSTEYVGLKERKAFVPHEAFYKFILSVESMCADLYDHYALFGDAIVEWVQASLLANIYLQSLFLQLLSVFCGYSDLKMLLYNKTVTVYNRSRQKTFRYSKGFLSQPSSSLRGQLLTSTGEKRGQIVGRFSSISATMDDLLEQLKTNKHLVIIHLGYLNQISDLENELNQAATASQLSLLCEGLEVETRSHYGKAKLIEVLVSFVNSPPAVSLYR